MQPIDPQDDPLTPPLGQSLQEGRTQSAPPPGFNPGNLVDSWNKWVDKPNNRAALMQFGIAMLQPVGMGETGTSHFANAIGAAGQAHQNVTKEAEEAEKSSTEAELRTSRAAAAETSANAAETRALYAGENAALRKQTSEATNLARSLQAQASAREKYEKYVNDPLRDPTQPPMSYEDFLRLPENVPLLGAGAGGTTSVDPAATGGASAEGMLTDPRMQTGFQNIKAAIASGDPGKVQRARAALQRLSSMLPPEERTKLFSRLGVNP